MENNSIAASPSIHVVYRDIDQIVNWSDIARPGYDPATISDTELKSLVANFLDRPETLLAGTWVSRPQAGSIVIMEKPSYG